MKNKSAASATSTALGPRPTPTAAPAPRSAARVRVLRRLRDQPEPTTLATLSEATGLHGNTLREHLTALVDEGLARRVRAAPHGRGRPAWLYEATTGGATSGSVEYAGLATTLAAAIHHGSSDPRATAIAAGTAWGHDLARQRGAEADTDATRTRRQVLDLLDDLGFAPRDNQQDPTVRLTQCPLLDAAHRHTDVVCGVHLGIVRGALAEHGASPADTDLEPFAEPGACLLQLPVPTRAPR